MSRNDIRPDVADGFMRDARRFRLVRDEDETGVSGTGVVAVGVEFPSGSVVMEWLNDENDDLHVGANGLAIKPGETGVEDTREIHGHGGRTRVEFVDPSRAVREGDAELCPACGDEFPLDALVESRNGALSCPACELTLRGAETED